MTSVASGKHRGQRRLVTEVEPGQFARWDASARALGMSGAAFTRAVLDESVKMPEIIVFGVRAVGTDQIRFVGRTARTLEQRRREGVSGKLGEWCAGVEWELFELERTTVSASAEAEARWVAELGGDGLLFNPRAGASGAVVGEVRFAVGLPRETHAAALELACAGHWSLGAFVQLAVEKLIERMKAGESVEVRAPGAAPQRAHGVARPLAVDTYVAANPATGDRARMVMTVPRERSARPGSALNPHSATGTTRDDEDDLDEESA